MIRKATIHDLPALVPLAVESLQCHPCPMPVSKKVLTETLKEVIGKGKHFAWVSEMDGKVVGAVMAHVQQGMWFERDQCSVFMHYTKCKGGLVPLLYEFARWVKSRPAIKVAVVELGEGVDPRLQRFLERLGFGRQSVTLAYTRGT